MKKTSKLRYRVTFYRDGSSTYTTTQTAANSITACLMAEQQLFNLFPTAQYDYYDVQFAV